MMTARLRFPGQVAWSGPKVPCGLVVALCLAFAGCGDDPTSATQGDAIEDIVAAEVDVASGLEDAAPELDGDTSGVAGTDAEPAPGDTVGDAFVDVPSDAEVVVDVPATSDVASDDLPDGGADDDGETPVDVPQDDGGDGVEESCGNGVLDDVEECDDGAANSDTVPDACRVDCTLARCGDGVTDTGESCDDGNPDDSDACTALCEVGPDFAKPLPGQVVFNEIMIDPLTVADPEGEWIELVNLTQEPLSLSTCVLRDEDNDTWILGIDGIPAIIDDGDMAILAYSFEAISSQPPGGNVSVYAYANVLLSNQGDEIILECAGQEIDRVTWDTGWAVNEGATISLDPSFTTAEGNDDPAAWCPSTQPFEVGDLGTPLLPNAPCPPPSVDGCGVLVADASVYADTSVGLFVNLIEPGLTDSTDGVDTDPDMQVEIGYGPAGSEPDSEGWIWTSATGVQGWINGAGIDRWEVVVTFPEPGVRAVAARVSLDAGVTMVSCDGSQQLDASYEITSELTIDVLVNPCEGVICDDSPEMSCDANGVTAIQPEAPDGVCLIAQGQPACDYDVQAVDCGLSGQVCVAEVGCSADAPSPVGAGDLVISELMVKPAASVLPTGQWLELTNPSSSPMSLAGCTLSVGEQWTATIDVPLVIGAHDRRVLGRLSVPAANGGVELDWAWGNDLEFPSAGPALSLVCAESEIDAVSVSVAGGWSLETGVSLSLSPFHVDAEENDAPVNWCSGTIEYGSGDLGTPGVANPACPGDVDAIDGCYVANGVTENAPAGTPFVAAVWLMEEGITTLTASTDESPDILSEAGIGPEGTGPDDAGWTFFSSSPAVLSEMGFEAAPVDYDGYAAGFAAPAPGAWQLAFRVSADGGNTWTRCDRLNDGVFSVSHTTDLLVSDSACYPSPCEVALGPVCEGTVVSVQQGAALCTLDGGAANCDWPESEAVTDCSDLGATCASGNCVGLPAAPAAGDVVFSELLVIPAVAESDEWIEISLSAEAEATVYDLAGCTLTSDDEESWIVEADDPVAALVWSGAPMVLARSGENTTLGLAPYLVYGEVLTLDNLQDTVTLDCDGVDVDSVTWDTALGWPVPVGSSWAVGGNQLTASGNDTIDAWCDGIEGTPGGTNPLCPPLDEVLDDCRMLEFGALSLDPGDLFSVSGFLLDLGTTDVTAGVDPAPGLVSEIGYGPVGSDPADPTADWAWAVASPDPDWIDDDATGEDRWSGSLAVFEAGIWNVAMRASADGGQSWTLCDADGVANGYDSAEAGHLTIGAGVCVPNPCVEPPAAHCDGGDSLLFYESPGACAMVGEPWTAECSYTSWMFDCSPYGGCLEGACLAPPLAPAGFGELVISEVLRDSAGPAPDQGEWIEVFNSGPADLDLRGCHLGEPSAAIGGGLPVVVPAGGYAVIAKTVNIQQNGGVAATAVIPSMSLVNVSDHITLTCGSGVVDDIAYTLGWPGSEGVAMQLGAGAVDGDSPAITNNVAEVWCDAVEAYGTELNLGTPGAPNGACE